MHLENHEDEHNEFSREADEERLKLSFKDFLIAPEISGSSRSFSANRRIPAEKVTDRGEIVEIARDPLEEDAEHQKAAVLVHRNDDNVITCIELVCSCGKRTLIRLEDDGSGPGDEGTHMNFEGTYDDGTDG